MIMQLGSNKVFFLPSRATTEIVAKAPEVSSPLDTSSFFNNPYISFIIMSILKLLMYILLYRIYKKIKYVILSKQRSNETNMSLPGPSPRQTEPQANPH